MNISLNDHLFGQRKKRVLSLDGGGVRGAISIAFLERLENVLKDIYGKKIDLCDWFDLVGGTSTGAIIAAALAVGYSAAEINKFYRDLAPKVFSSQWFRIPGIQASFNSDLLRNELERRFSGIKLDSEEIKTGILLVLKRLDTGSPWIISNNPKSKFWETPNDSSFIGNRHLLLTELIRASAAAPYYFDPQLIEICPGMNPGVFLDGGVSPHNNPSLALLMTILIPHFGLNWHLSPENLFFLSIGTGFYRPTVTVKEAASNTSLRLAVDALAAMINDAQELTITIMSILGRNNLPWHINSEIGDLTDFRPAFDFLFNYHRCDIKLERSWLSSNLNVFLSESEVDVLREMDNPDNIASLYSYGKLAANQQITHELVSTW